MYEQRLATLERGLAGCHGETIDGNSITYYDTRIRGYYGELVQGGFVIDKGKCLDAHPGLAIMAPLCKACLLPGGRVKFPGAEGSIVAQAIAQEEGNGYSGLARLMLAAPDCGAFDDVAPDVFADWWASKGARVGERIGNRIVWRDGVEESIPAFEQRYEGGQS